MNRPPQAASLSLRVQAVRRVQTGHPRHHGKLRAQLELVDGTTINPTVAELLQDICTQLGHLRAQRSDLRERLRQLEDQERPQDPDARDQALREDLRHVAQELQRRAQGAGLQSGVRETLRDSAETLRAWVRRLRPAPDPEALPVPCPEQVSDRDAELHGGQVIFRGEDGEPYRCHLSTYLARLLPDLPVLLDLALAQLSLDDLQELDGWELLHLLERTAADRSA